MRLLSLLLALICLLVAGPVLAQAAPEDRPCIPLPDVVTPTDTPVQIGAIVVRGLHRTRESVVLNELPFAVGDHVDARTWAFALTRLWNCALFDHVDGYIERDPGTGRLTAVFDLEEVWTLNPLFSFAVGGNAAWVRAGASDTNVAGRFLELGAQYERFTEFNGYQFWARDPRFLGKRLDWIVLVERLVRPRPAYADRRLRIVSEVFGLWENDRLKVSGRVGADYDVLLPIRTGGDGDPPPGTDNADDAPHNWAAVLETGVRVGRLDTVRVRTTGATLELKTTWVATRLATFGGFAQSWLEGLGHLMLGERWNLSARVQAGVQGDAPDYNRFWLGGLQHIRGYVDNYARADKFALLNAEARFTAYDSRWISFVGVAFVDGAVTHEPAGGVRPMLSTGVGVRGLLPWMVKTGARVDMALPLVDARCPQGAALCPGLSIGVYQFF